jgi:hypothetical protein
LKTQQRTFFECRELGVGFGLPEYINTSSFSRFHAGERPLSKKLKVKVSPALAGDPFFTESLILAQDERWRRA